MTEERIFTLAELEQYDGAEGRPAYVAYKGRVVDVSGSKLWKAGQHMRRHQSGADLTEALKNAPHGSDVLERMPQVGVLASSRPETPTGRELPAIIKRFPFLKRHPHPMTVHFPLVLSIFAPLFLLLFLISGNRAFELTSLHLLGASLLFTPVAIVTGLYTWWLNYMAQPIKSVRYKMALSPVLYALTVVAFFWRLGSPEVATSALYVLLVLALFPLVSLIGWYGALMTFPPHED